MPTSRLSSSHLHEEVKPVIKMSPHIWVQVDPSYALDTKDYITVWYCLPAPPWDEGERPLRPVLPADCSSRTWPRTWVGSQSGATTTTGHMMAGGGGITWDGRTVPCYTPCHREPRERGGRLGRGGESGPGEGVSSVAGATAEAGLASGVTSGIWVEAESGVMIKSWHKSTCWKV